MSEREGIEMDDGLRGWLDDALVGLELEADDGAVQPQFAEVVARAHAIDPELVSEDQLEEARALAPVVPLGAALVSDPGPDAALGAFLDDVRADADAATRQRALAAIPTPPARHRRPPRMSMVAAAVAAVLVLGVGIAGAFSALRGEADAPAMQAGHDAVDPLPSPASTPDGGAPSHEAQVVEPPAPEPTPTPIEAPTPATETRTDDEAEVVARERAATARSDRRDDLEDRLRALDERAQALWKAGDLAGAEQAFREIIRIGKRGHYVQLAYGDLFNLARGWAAKRRRALWNEYLDRFPRGRHADDARGGLCRLAPEGERTRCWERYLADMPDGSYRHTAVRALEKGE